MKGLSVRASLTTMFAVGAMLLAGEGGAEEKSCVAATTVLVPKIPFEPAPTTAFADTLKAMCAELKAAALPVPGGGAAPAFAFAAIQPAISACAADPQATAAQAAIASLAALQVTCSKLQLIAKGQPVKIEATDLDNVREAYAQRDALAAVVSSLRPGQTGCGIFGPASGGFQSAAAALVEESLPWQAAIINALAKFVVDRAKAEALLYLSQRLKETLCTDEGRRYLRNFCGAFDALDANIQLTSMGVFLQAAALRDLQRAPAVVAVDAGCSTASSANAGAAARWGLAIFEEARTGRPPLEVARNLHRASVECEAAPTVTFADKSKGPYDCKKASAAIKTASRFTDAVLRQSNLTTMAQAPSGDDKWTYFGLSVLMTYEELQGGTDVAIERVLPFATAAAQFTGGLVDLRTRFQQLQQGGENLDAGDHAALATRTVRTVGEIALTLGDGTNALTEPERRTLSTMTAIATAGEEVTEEASPAGLAIAISDLALHLSDTVPGYSGSLPAPLRRSLPLLVEIASAKTSDQVVVVLEAAAAPVGGYRTKYERPTLAVNAFVGGSIAHERLDDPGSGTDGVAAGVFAPIGLHATWPAGDFHFGGMLSLLDLGAIVSPRISAETESATGGEPRVLAEPKVGFAQVFAPGLYFTAGILDSPFVVGGGVSMIPALRKVERTETLDDGTAAIRIDERTAFRAGLFVAIDVTLFPF